MKLVVIDTLQKVRGSTENSYGSDYKELSVLKGLADKLRITVLLVTTHENVKTTILSI